MIDKPMAKVALRLAKRRTLRMASAIKWEVEFEVVVQPATQGRFSIPTHICKALGLNSGDSLSATMTIGSLTICDNFRLESGFEIILRPSHVLYESAKPNSKIVVKINHISHH
jgi:hypothetical protein